MGTLGRLLIVCCASSLAGLVPALATPGCLDVDGGATFGAATTFRVEIASATPCTGHDRLRATGPGISVSLANASLDLDVLPIYTSTAQVGDQMTVIELTDAGSSIAGTFAGLADGATLSVAGVTFTIDYDGGDGNDVVLETTGLTPGCLTVDGNASFAGASTLALEIDGTTPCSEHNQLVVTGSARTVDLGGMSLQLDVTPAYETGALIGDQLTIVDLADPSSVLSGTFAGIPNGGSVSVGMLTFTVDYNGGDGNDVVLDVIALPVELLSFTVE
ncbi:MAG: hypothetical protein MPN21_16910 [Thermoanaerobaculia bacterium]|nr:hypothetical protein [Thermoanaerobaculia bacterium]